MLRSDDFRSARCVMSAFFHLITARCVCLGSGESSRNGSAVLLKDGTVSAGNIRNIYYGKHINAYM
ncbi:hypothetical protein D3C74_425110 [compost metagenome]